MSGLLMVFFSFCLTGDGRLSVEDARVLLESTPDFLRATSGNRCPQIELLWSGEHDVAYQMRSRCTNSPSGLIGNYIVDRHTAEVWIGVDRDHLVESKRLRKLQQILLKRVRGGSGRNK